MSFSTSIANPVSSTNLNPTGIVSDLENALMQSIEQGVQGGQSTDSGTLQKEMQLLTALLNQSDSTQNDPSKQGASTGTGQSPTHNDGTSNNKGISRAESRLERALEQNITNLLQNNQNSTNNNNNSLQQEMNLLIELLGQTA
ncbi:MAG: hypothetical protein JOZ48_18255 [Acidobacteriaceae bacterium]|nr:hypothetical protein [Acidobacteriaceae bacterium]